MQTALYLFVIVILCMANFILWSRYSRQINQYADQLRKEQERAEAAEKKAMDQIRLLAVISHELRTPLQTVVTSTDLLLFRSQNDDEKKIINRLHKASEQIEAQIADMSTYSHILSGMLVLSKASFNPQEELKTTVDEFSEAGEKKGLSFHCDFTDPDKTIVSDARRFRQIATNLISNTVKYAVPGPVNISLTFQQINDIEPIQMVLVVEDSGPGIPPKLLPSIFNEFSQGKNHNSQATGIGMGLAVIVRLITLMGGTINVSSPLGKGAKFTVRLPVTTSQPTIAGAD